MNKFILGLAFGLGVTAASSVTMAAGCKVGDIELYRDAHKIVCKDREEYAACIKDAGEQMKQDLGRNCGIAYKNCFEQKSLDISLDTATCLALSLAGCGTGQSACAVACNVQFTAREWVAYHQCTVEVTPCYEDALARDKARKELCKQ